MKKEPILKYTIEGLSKQVDPYTVQNLMVYDESKQVPEYIFDNPHSLDSIVFSICTKGTARFKVNMQEYSLSPNTIVTILPNTIVEPIERSKDFSMETVLFSFDFIADLPLPSGFDLFDIIEQRPCIPITEEETLNLLKYHRFIADKNNRVEHRFRREITKYLLFALVTEIGSLYSDKEKLNTQTQMGKLAGNFLALLRRHYKEERHLYFYAKKLCLTPKYLTSTIKRVTGKSVLVWIHEAVIASAKVQLKSSNNTVAQISEDLNFNDPSIFGRFFKKHTGMTPIQYRESEIRVVIP